MPVPKKAKRTRSADPDSLPAKWPTWTQEQRTAQFEEWRSHLGHVNYPRWVKAMGDTLGGGIAGLTREELATSYRAWIEYVGLGGAQTPYLSTRPEQCAGTLAAVARMRRAESDPVRRSEQMALIVHGRAVA